MHRKGAAHARGMGQPGGTRLRGVPGAVRRSVSGVHALNTRPHFTPLAQTRDYLQQIRHNGISGLG